MPHTSLFFTVLLTLAPLGAGAQSSDLTGLAGSYDIAQNRTSEDVVGSLVAEGYNITATGRTLLGRTKITAQNGFHTREVVVSRTTGEILSDAIVSVEAPASAVTPRITIGGKVTFTWNSNGSN